MKKAAGRTTLNRFLLATISLIVLLGMMTALALALGQGATLTIRKTTTPAGGKDFPISAVSYQSSIETKFPSPRAISQDSQGLLYVVGHRASQVEVLDSAGNSIRVWGTKGKGEEDLFRPEDLNVFDDGTGVIVYVADTGSSRVKYFTDTGDYLGSWGGEGSGNGQFLAPQGIIVSPSRTVYVADTFNHRIQEFSGTGDFIRTWGSQGSGEGQFSYPSGISLDPAGNVYVADSNNQRIQVFNADGQYLWQWGHEGTGPGEFNVPVDVHASANGAVYVSDLFNNRVQKFTPDGRFLTQWGETGTGDGQFERPQGILTDVNDGLTYVVDIDNSRVEAFAETTLFVDDGEEEAVVLPSGTYAVTEAVSEPWMLANVTCSGGQPVPIANGVQLTLEEATSVNCTFENAGKEPATYAAYLGYIAR